MNKKINFKDKSQWFGENLSDWSIIRAKYIFKNKSSKNHKNEELLSVNQKSGVVKRSDLENRVWNPSEDISGYKLVKSGDFVISLRSFEGGLELSKIRGLVSPAYTVLENIKEINNDYFWWLMKSNQFIIELNKHVSGIRQGKNIAWDDFSNIYLLNPPLKVQNLISQYLKKKTQEIDLLVKKIEKKIELIKEQKYMLINQSVTKGLDPLVKLKHIGIPYLGSIPNHWIIKRIKYIAEVNTGTTPSTNNKEFYKNGKYLWIKPGNLNEFIPITSTDQKLSDSGLSVSRQLKENSCLVCGIGEIGKFGFSHKKVTSNQQIHGITFDEQFVIPEYGKFIVGSLKERLERESEKVVVSILTKRRLEQIQVCIPPLMEQRQIIDHLEKYLEYSEQLFKKEKKRIDLLNEYRKSLISSVVTGKIKITEDML